MVKYSDKYGVKALFILLIYFYLLVPARAANLALLGFVAPSVEVQIADQIKFLSNSEFIIETQDSSGQIQRVFLQYNKKLSLKKKNLKRVIVYAP